MRDDPVLAQVLDIIGGDAEVERSREADGRTYRRHLLERMRSDPQWLEANRAFFFDGPGWPVMERAIREASATCA